jgi:hypothetical protein
MAAARNLLCVGSITVVNDKGMQSILPYKKIAHHLAEVEHIRENSTSLEYASV